MFKLKFTTAALLLSVIVFGISFSYYNYFSSALQNNLWQNIDGFTRIVVPDTFVYKDIVDPSNYLRSIMLSGVKNTAGPSFIWWMTNKNWVLVSLINSFFLFLALRYQIKIARILGIKKRMVIVITFVLSLIPLTIYYSVGSLKEIATMTFLLGFYYHYVKGNYVKWILSSLVIVLFRYQMIIIIVMFLFCDMLRKRALLATLSVLFLISAVYPFISDIAVLSPDVTLIYREAQEGTIGANVEFVRGNVPFISTIAVMIRVIQSIFEPLIEFIREPSFYEDGNISIFRVVNVVSSGLMFIFWLYYLKNIILSFFRPFGLRRNVMRLYVLSLLYLVTVGGFSFIHHRYLYPMTAIVLLVSVTDKMWILPASRRFCAIADEIAPESR